MYLIKGGEKMSDKTFNTIDELYKYTAKSENLYDVLAGQTLDIECPVCNKKIKVKINSNKICKCPICGEEFKLNLKSK
jgi:ribosomal protein L37AE/L43A